MTGTVDVKENFESKISIGDNDFSLKLYGATILSERIYCI